MYQLQNSGDNAAMIGAAAYYAYNKGIVGNLEQNAMAVDSLYQKM